MSILTKQKVMSQVMALMESGLTPEEIAKTMQAERERAIEGESESDEEFPKEIRTMSQALAFRVGTIDDIQNIWKLLNKAYGAETSGSEAFRSGEAVMLSTIEHLFADESYRWTLMEAPSGHDEESDGVLLGLCCFSTTGVSRRNGEIEGLLGSIRYLAVVPRYHGLCAGLRLLRRVERDMARAGCVRCLVSLPSPRVKLLDWIERRGYECVNELPYPESLGHVLSIPDVTLLLFVKSLKAPQVKAEAMDDEDSTGNDRNTTTTTTKVVASPKAVGSASIVGTYAQANSGEVGAVTGDNAKERVSSRAADKKRGTARIFTVSDTIEVNLEGSASASASAVDSVVDAVVVQTEVPEVD